MTRSFRAIKGIADHNLAQLCRGVEMAIHPVEQIKKALQVLLGIACRARTKGFEQAFPFRWRKRACSCHLVFLQTLPTQRASRGQSGDLCRGAVRPTGNRLFPSLKHIRFRSEPLATCSLRWKANLLPCWNIEWCIEQLYKKSRRKCETSRRFSA